MHEKAQITHTRTQSMHVTMLKLVSVWRSMEEKQTNTTKPLFHELVKEPPKSCVEIR